MLVWLRLVLLLRMLSVSFMRKRSVGPLVRFKSSKGLV